jgi:phosphoserine phosphatase RsbU/P
MSDARILIVDDIEDNRYTLGMLLDLEGYTHVTQAGDGAEALQRLRAEEFDLVLLDVMMPKLNGYQVLEQLKAEGRLHRVPVVMISALQEMGSVVRCIELGAEDYLPKPFDPVLLKARIGACLEKKRLRDQTTSQLERMEAELRGARELQESMVPKRFAPPGPENPVEVAGLLRPARELGGDLYDFFGLVDGTYAFVIGDVSDKGVGAALFMARTLGTVRLIASNYRAAPGRPTDPGGLLTAMNDELCRNNDALMFVTLFLGVIDLEARLLHFASAGHEDPYVLAGTGALARVTPARGLPLGVRADTRYEARSLALAPGDTLFAYTDGVTDGANSSEEQYGEQRLQAALSGLAGKSPADVVAAVAESVDRFVAGAPASDDITMLAARPT